jgi:hypothetical protein
VPAELAWQLVMSTSMTMRGTPASRATLFDDCYKLSAARLALETGVMQKRM